MGLNGAVFKEADFIVSVAQAYYLSTNRYLIARNAYGIALAVVLLVHVAGNLVSVLALELVSGIDKHKVNKLGTRDGALLNLYHRSAGGSSASVEKRVGNDDVADIVKKCRVGNRLVDALRKTVLGVSLHETVKETLRTHPDTAAVSLITGQKLIHKTLYIIFPFDAP